jgi:hypothetical protein
MRSGSSSINLSAAISGADRFGILQHSEQHKNSGSVKMHRQEFCIDRLSWLSDDADSGSSRATKGRLSLLRHCGPAGASVGLVRGGQLCDPLRTSCPPLACTPSPVLGNVLQKPLVSPTHYSRGKWAPQPFEHASDLSPQITARTNAFLFFRLRVANQQQFRAQEPARMAMVSRGFKCCKLLSLLQISRTFFGRGGNGRLGHFRAIAAGNVCGCVLADRPWRTEARALLIEAVVTAHGARIAQAAGTL